MTTYVRQLTVWKNYLLAGCGNSLIKMFAQSGTCLDSVYGIESEGMIESLVAWKPEGQEGTFVQQRKKNIKGLHSLLS